MQATTDNKGERIKALLDQVGIRCMSVIVLGKFVHIHTYKKYEAKVRSTFHQMGAKTVQVLTNDAAGRGMNGKKSHHLVATF